MPGLRRFQHGAGWQALWRGPRVPHQTLALGARSPARLGFGLVLFALLAGCSSTKFVYDRLDWFVSWRLDDYLSLRADQRPIYDAAFDALWRWHRQEELPRYAAELRAIAAALDREVTAAQLEQRLLMMQGAYEALARHAIPQFCPLAPTLDDKQKREILRGMDRSIAERAAEFGKQTESERRREHEERLLKQLRRWLGSVTPEQKQKVGTVTAEMRILTGGWIDYRRRWREAFAAVLLAPPQDDCRDYYPLYLESEKLWSEELREGTRYNQHLTGGFMLELLNHMTPEQRQHLQRELLQLARDFEQLARRKL